MVNSDGGDGSVQPLKAGDPERIGPYRLLGRLGAGGMGRVFLARSEGGRTVAVKVVHEEHVADDRFRARFQREIAAARKVGERYTAPVLDSGPDADEPWVATGYVPGLTLEQVVRSHGPLPVPSVHALADHLLHALREIHAAGIVHRDLKPSNVMLTASGTKVIDFGIARALDTSSVESLLTSTGVVLGSPGFMSPEQIRGQGAGPASDVFTLGHILTYAATGALPFGRGAENQHAVMFRIVQDEPELAAIEDPGLRTLITRCLTKDEAERPGVDELLDDPDRTKPVASSGSWLPAEVMARLAQQSARLLEADSAPIRVTAEADDSGSSAVPAEGGEATPAVSSAQAGEPAQTPASGQPGAPEPGRRPRRRNRFIAVPVVLVLTVGGGTVALLQPFSGDSDHGGTHAQDRKDGGTTIGQPSADGGSPSKDADAGKDAKKGKDASPGSDGKGDRAGAGTSGADATAPGSGPADGRTDGGDSDGASSGGSGSDGGSSSGSSSGSGSGDAGSSGAVPAYFAGKWHIPGEGYSPTPQKATISHASVGDQAVRLYYNMGFGTCTYAARLTSVTNNGKRINLSAAPVVADNAGGQCKEFQASSFYVSEDGLNHDVGPAYGSGMHFVRQ